MSESPKDPIDPEQVPDPVTAKTTDSEILMLGNTPVEAARPTNRPKTDQSISWTPLETAGERVTIDEYLGKSFIAKPSRPEEAQATPSFRAESKSGDGDDARYEVGEVLASGGMGTILRARDRDLRRQVAMKVILNNDRVSEEELLRFVEEAQVTGQLEHPNIVPIHELGIDVSGNVYFTMKLVRGISLSDVLNGLRRRDQEIVEKYPLSRLLTIFIKICDAVAFAHSKGVVHRDLKPSNVMVGDFGEVLVVDWGIVKILQDRISLGAGISVEPDGDQPDWATDTIESARGDFDGNATRAGQIMGTPNYMAPEQARGRSGGADRRSDIYALGGILYCMLTLQRPVDGSGVQIYDRILHGDIRHPSMFNPGNREKCERKGVQTFDLVHCTGERIPESLSAVAMKALSLEPDARYQTVERLAAEIETFQAGFATEAEGADVRRHFSLMVGRHRREFALIVGCVVFAIVVLAAAILISSISIGRANERVRKIEKQLAEERAKDRPPENQ